MTGLTGAVGPRRASPPGPPWGEAWPRPSRFGETLLVSTKRGRAIARGGPLVKPRPASRSALNECQEVRVDDLRVGGAHPMRQAVVGLEGAVLQQLDRERRRVRIGHDLVVGAVHHQ